MEIRSEDVQEITVVGQLNGDDVKLIKTYGGLNVMVAKKDKNSKKPEAIAAASHRALAMHQMEKVFGSAFQPSMAKSENEQIEVVTEFSVSEELKKNHLEIFSLAKDNAVDFVVSRFGAIMCKYECEVVNGQMSLKRYGNHPKAKEFLGKNSASVSESVKNAILKYSEQIGIAFKK